MSEYLLQKIQQLRADLAHLSQTKNGLQGKLMDLYLNATHGEPPAHLIEELSGIGKACQAHHAALAQLEAETLDLYVSPGATDETPEQLLLRMQEKTQLAHKEEALAERLSTEETTIGLLFQRANAVGDSLTKGQGAQSLAALKAKLGVGNKKLGE